MTAVIVNDGPQAKWFKVYITGDAETSAHSLGSIANPEGVDLHICAGFLKIIAPPAGAADLDIGIGATGADSTDLASDMSIDGFAADAIYYIVSNNRASQAAATTTYGLLWESDTYLNFYENAGAESAAFEGMLYLQYIRIGDDVTRA